VIDAGGCYVKPGGINPHTHLELAIIPPLHPPPIP
jgi:cytosine/adenosine deaminase-related metal-dependent hydrolase